MGEYHFCNSSGSGVTGVPHPRFLRVGVMVWNAKGTEAPLRARPSSFSDVQLLPAVAVAGECASKKLVRQGTAQGSARVWVPSGGLRGDAESCASVDRRAKEGHAVDSVADAQATRLSEDEAEREGGAKGATFSEISEVHHRAAAVLAAAVLRFQRIQPQEEERKTGVYARESCGARTREASEGLALEQFFILCKRGSRISRDRSHQYVGIPSRINSKKRSTLANRGQGKVKSPALKNRGRGTQIRLGICIRATRPLIFTGAVVLAAYAKAARLFAEYRTVNRAGSRRT